MSREHSSSRLSSGRESAAYVGVISPHPSTEPVIFSKAPKELGSTSVKELTSTRFSELYRYATSLDKVMLSIGCLCSAINGALFPCMALVFGDAITAFANADGSVDRDQVNSAALKFAMIAIALFVTDYMSFVIFSTTAERQMMALRNEALKHMLYLDISWYDCHDALQLSSRLTGDTIKIKDALGQKLGDSIKYMCQCLTGYIIGFSRGWDMALVMACAMPFMALSLGSLLKMLRSRAEHSQQLYAEAGAVAEETLGSIRTVAALNGEKIAMAKYNAKALIGEQENISMAKYASVVFGVFMGSIWLMYAGGLWYGGSRVSSNAASPADVFSSFFGMLIGTVSLAQISPNISAIAEGRGSAAAIYKIIATPSAVDASNEDGTIPTSCAGKIEAKGLYFAYPSRTDVSILQNYTVTIESGQTVAFVGESGGGKSTLIALLERFYDPDRGCVYLDGQDIKTLNVKWLRSQIGMVSQEPVLFAATIHENIVSGNDNLTRDEVIVAAKMANAHDFILTLPEGYDTLIGEKGASLSGGQKQRIAIARAIIRKPKILVLDEATSALDAQSERIVQDALNDLMEKTKMTTLVIAHRLTTVRHADKIVVLSKGHVTEEGKHDDLLKIDNGIYKRLYQLQERSDEAEEDEASDEDVDIVERQNSAVLPHMISYQSNQSIQSDITDLAKEAGVEKNETNFSLVTAMRFSQPEKKYFIVGMIAAGVCGFAMPCSSLLISELVAIMTQKYSLFMTTQNHVYLDELSDKVMIYGLCYVGGAVGMFLFTSIQNYCFKFMAQKLITRMRDIHFGAMCRQNIAYFDIREHSTGALTANLSVDATKVALLSGDSQGRVMQAAFTFVAALVISFTTGSWLLTLIMLAIFPLLIVGHMVRGRLMQKAAAGTDELAEVGAHASEALSNIRTVVSLGLEKQIVGKFNHLLEAPLEGGRKEAQINGLAIGFSSFIVFMTYAFVFYLGGYLVDKKEINFKEMMRTLMAVMMSAQGVGQAVSFLGDSDRGLKSGKAILELQERVPPIDSFDDRGMKLKNLSGKIEFKNLYFRYPTRPEVPVLNRYNLKINAGQTVAFCGPSGGGKSTCIGLLERYYDPLKGQVLFDGIDAKELNLFWLRSRLGLVGQEPTLFIGTIAENIAMGLGREPSQAEIEEAAQMANAHGFISKFPDGYETQVGLKGEQLSGGQKQRIAIARAILKDPDILLLDEATSALDSESEKIVQEALDKVVALKRRTTIIIAHRLSTIRKADKICVVSGGKIAEEGTHGELLKKNGIYARLVETATN